MSQAGPSPNPMLKFKSNHKAISISLCTLFLGVLVQDFVCSLSSCYLAASSTAMSLGVMHVYLGNIIYLMTKQLDILNCLIHCMNKPTKLDLVDNLHEISHTFPILEPPSGTSKFLKTRGFLLPTACFKRTPLQPN